MSNEEKLKHMHDGDTEYFNWFEEGGLEIHSFNSDWFVYDIPQYGGLPQYVGRFESVHAVLKIISKYT